MVASYAIRMTYRWFNKNFVAGINNVAIPSSENNENKYRQFIWHVTAQSQVTMTSSNGNNLRVIGHLYAEFTGDRWIGFRQIVWTNQIRLQTTPVVFH